MSGSGRALLFDVGRGLADTDALHLKAFNQVFAASWPCVRSRARLERADGIFQYFDQRTVSAGPIAGATGRHHGGEGTSVPQARVGPNQTVGGSDETACPGGSR